MNELIDRQTGGQADEWSNRRTYTLSAVSPPYVIICTNSLVICDVGTVLLVWETLIWKNHRLERNVFIVTIVCVCWFVRKCRKSHMFRIYNVLCVRNNAEEEWPRYHVKRWKTALAQVNSCSLQEICTKRVPLLIRFDC